ncbi:MAG: hypothetical protein ACRC67_27150 [Inquilinus sp.]|uniref:hypothetical protein n=1 Tax=Inquilinus sp. TaxID=1932117 RepID=UPI003F2FD91F
MPQSFRHWKDSFPSLKKSASGPEPNRTAAIDADEAGAGAFPPQQPRRVPKPAGAAASVRTAVDRKKYFGRWRSDFFCLTINLCTMHREYQDRTEWKDRSNLQNFHIC